MGVMGETEMMRQKTVGRAVRRLGRAGLVAALLGAALLAGCASRPPEAPPAPAKPDWQAAIGRLEVKGSHQDCTGVLIRPDVVLTAAHCLHPKGFLVSASQVSFVPSMPGAERASGLGFLVQGAEVPQGHIARDLIPFDWAAIRISPLTSIAPMPIAPMSLDQAMGEIARGAKFYSAGYGQGAKNRLMAHERCSLLPAESAELATIYFTSSCVVRLGDSGGPVALVNGNRPKLIGLIVGFDPRPDIAAPVGFIAPASAFAPYLAAPLVGSLENSGKIPKTSMN
jgi:V8-like Glu-specific endopeptidase